jgi:hypothetical protein
MPPIHGLGWQKLSLTFPCNKAFMLTLFGRRAGSAYLFRAGPGGAYWRSAGGLVSVPVCVLAWGEGGGGGTGTQTGN